jgi:hypothetical protein
LPQPLLAARKESHVLRVFLFEPLEIGRLLLEPGPQDQRLYRMLAMPPLDGQGAFINLFGFPLNRIASLAPCFGVRVPRVFSPRSLWRIRSVESPAAAARQRSRMLCCAR